MAYKFERLAQEGPALEQNLEYLYLRRSILDHLIRSLELYERFPAGKKPRMSSAISTQRGQTLRQLAS
jgi:hypothetical protein